MASSDLATLSAIEVAALIKARKASPVEVLRAVLGRIDAWEPRLNAFVVLDRERALLAAAEAEAALMRGADLGPLHGVPVSIKDLQHVTGLPTRRGSHMSDPAPAREDSALVARLRAAGAIILGKTTMSDQGWVALSDSPLTGSTHNPWRRGFTAGGSSSGAAALAGAACGPLHMGSDGAGSIRIPAHFCGAVGIKPTFGTVPYTPISNNGLISHAGPITRTVDDAALMLEVMAGPHPLDPMTHPLGFRRQPALEVKGLRIAFSPDLGHARVDPDIAACVARSVRVLEQLGAHVEQVTPHWGPAGPAIERAIWKAAYALYALSMPANSKAIDPGLAACIHEATGATWLEVSAAQGRRFAYSADIAQWFASGWDLLVTPSASVAAFEHGRLQPRHWPEHAWDWLTWAEFSYPFNLSHSPAISVPCGLTDDGLPIGLQIVGPRFADGLVLDAAKAFLAAQPFDTLPPMPT